jgi:hypothetical protein
MRRSSSAFVALLVATGSASAQLGWYSVDLTTGYDPGHHVETLDIPAFELPDWGRGPLRRVEIDLFYSGEFRLLSSQPLESPVRVSIHASSDYRVRIAGVDIREDSFMGQPFSRILLPGFESPGPWTQAHTIQPGGPIPITGGSVFNAFASGDPVQMIVDRTAAIGLISPPTPEYITLENRSIMEFTVTYFFVPVPPAGAAALLLGAAACIRRRRTI